MTPEPKLASETQEQQEAAPNPAPVHESAVVAPPVSEPPPAPSEPAGEPAPQPETKPAAPAPPPEPEAKLAAAAPPAEPDAEPEAAPMPDPDKLLGMGEGEILKWLGPPASRRDEPPANVWRYATESCALEVVFFLDVSDSTRRVLSYDFEVEKEGGETAASCFKAIEKGHADALQDLGSR
jgi:hypothetical protein